MTVVLDNSGMERLSSIVRDGTWELGELPHALWRARKDGAVVTAYKSGKITIQGKGTDDFVEFVLEPFVTGVLPSTVPAPAASEDAAPALPWPHAGIDESGKGDYFGPLAVAAVFVESDSVARELTLLGAKDSKLIKNDAQIKKVAAGIRQAVSGKFAVVSIGPEAYNRLYDNIGNLNKLLAWGHARVLENLLERAPDCRLAISDKFGASSLIKNALMEKGRSVELHQRVRGESDLAVAAASILARDRFVSDLAALSETVGMELPKGASAKVDEVASRIVSDFGLDRLRSLAKLHFKTTDKALARSAASSGGTDR